MLVSFAISFLPALITGSPCPIMVGIQCENPALIFSTGLTVQPGDGGDTAMPCRFGQGWGILRVGGGEGIIITLVIEAEGTIAPAKHLVRL